jgi:hypothetical protein
VIDEHLTGDDGRSALVAVVDDLEKLTALLAGERSQAPVIEDKKLDARQRLEQACVARPNVGSRSGE